MKATINMQVRFHGIKSTTDQTLVTGALVVTANVSIPAAPLVGQYLDFGKPPTRLAPVNRNDVSEVMWVPVANRPNVFELVIILTPLDCRSFQGDKVDDTLEFIRHELQTEFSAQTLEESPRLGEIHFTQQH